jgi:hypothetical protein
MNTQNTTRCQVCRKILKIQPFKIIFARSDGSIEEMREICLSCHNKYLVLMREDTMLEDYHPEEFLPQRVLEDKAISSLRKENMSRNVKHHNMNFGKNKC